MGVTLRSQEGRPQYIQAVGIDNGTKGNECIYSQPLQIRQAAENTRWQHSDCIIIEEPVERTPLVNKEKIITTSTIQGIRKNMSFTWV